mgnify:CR=1 FL=1
MFNIKRVNTVLRQATYYSVNWDRFLICYAHYHLKLEHQYCAYLVYCKVYAAGKVYAADKVYAAGTVYAAGKVYAATLFYLLNYLVYIICFSLVGLLVFPLSHTHAYVRIVVSKQNLLALFSCEVTYCRLFSCFYLCRIEHIKAKHVLKEDLFFLSFLYYFRIILINHCKNSNLSVRWMFNTF